MSVTCLHKSHACVPWSNAVYDSSMWLAVTPPQSEEHFALCRDCISIKLFGESTFIGMYILYFAPFLKRVKCFTLTLDVFYITTLDLNSELHSSLWWFNKKKRKKKKNSTQMWQNWLKFAHVFIFFKCSILVRAASNPEWILSGSEKNLHGVLAPYQL